MTTVACIRLPQIPDKFSLVLPGMGELTYMRDTLETMPRPSSMLLKFLNSVSPALSPLYAIIRVMDFVTAISACQSAIPKAITQLSPKPIIDCMPKLVQAVANLLPLVPPIAYLRMIVDIISLIRTLLADILQIMVIIDNEISQIKAVIQEAQSNNDPTLLEMGECAKHNLQQQTAGLMQILEVIGKLVTILMNTLDTLSSFPGMPPAIKDKIDEQKQKILGFEDAMAEVSVDDYPPLKQIAVPIQILVTVLTYVEQVGRAILGLNVTTMTFNFPEWQNPLP